MYISSKRKWRIREDDICNFKNFGGRLKAFLGRYEILIGRCNVVTREKRWPELVY
ncbi:MAG: hypothetical protein ACTSVI_03255 [Promethearchaeota archaeon]